MTDRKTVSTTNRPIWIPHNGEFSPLLRIYKLESLYVAVWFCQLCLGIVGGEFVW